MQWMVSLHFMPYIEAAISGRQCGSLWGLLPRTFMVWFQPHLIWIVQWTSNDICSSPDKGYISQVEIAHDLWAISFRLPLAFHYEAWRVGRYQKPCVIPLQYSFELCLYYSLRVIQLQQHHTGVDRNRFINIRALIWRCSRIIRRRMSSLTITF